MVKASRRLKKVVHAFNAADPEAYFKHIDKLLLFCWDSEEAEDYLYGVLAEATTASIRTTVARQVLEKTWVRRGDEAAFSRRFNE